MDSCVTRSQFPPNISLISDRFSPRGKYPVNVVSSKLDERKTMHGYRGQTSHG